MLNVFNYLALISESPEGLRRGSEFRDGSGVRNSGWLDCFYFNVKFRSGGMYKILLNP